MNKNKVVFGALGFLVLAIAAWSIIPPVLKMQDQKQAVLKLEEKLTEKFQELKALEQVKVKVDKTVELKEKVKNDLDFLEKILKSKESFPEIKFETVEVLNNSNMTELKEESYPIKIRMKAQFSKIGDYLVYLESCFSSIQIDKLDVFPVADDKNLICANLLGVISL